jgi:hypothetical protein
MDMASEDEFQIGDRVRLSPLGESRFPRSPSKVGVVVGFGHSETRLRVHIDGHTRPMTLHQTYVVKDRQSESQ